MTLEAEASVTHSNHSAHNWGDTLVEYASAEETSCTPPNESCDSPWGAVMPNAAAAMAQHAANGSNSHIDCDDACS